MSPGLCCSSAIPSTCNMPTDTARKLQERNDLVRRIKNHGYELPEMDSCANCVRRNVTCVSSPNDSRRCAECIRRNLKEKCDCMGPEHPDWVKLEREEDRLDREEEETLSKLLRLRKQKRLIRTRGKDMLRRGLKTLNELDAAEEAERVAAEKCDAVEAEEQAVSAASSSVIGTPASSDPLAYSPASWDQWLADGGVDIPPAVLC
ncbi:hypothetical protein GMDG_08793 [Pseudogymnoascus destructans 20631-21]|uniref:Zn(2)-C6 fungal-type domain-containing protein n=2 Tax=Pseudogymnoascus destructans (strain ATCC MYA-4855 / 20631-21) TaxID=658429 RepID=L8FMI1_PSED2|nr:hypothetical protein GMDG_08793 [Pseudogymnoascus destructans 20631-21]